LAAADDSESGNAALVQAADLAGSRRAQLVVLTVISRNRQSGSVSDALNEFARAEHFEGETAARSVIAENALAEAKAIVADRHDLKATCISRIGDPADEILACARQLLSDVILLGRRGRGPRWKRLTEDGELGGCSVTIVPSAE
jgi:nucleotide-binding universal stress UspA family protein